MKIAVLGCGVMGSAFARQLAKRGDELFVCDRNREKGIALADELGASFVGDPKEAAESAEVVLLAIKPNEVQQMSQQLHGLKKRIFLSILTGTSIAEIQTLFPGMEIIRSVPNLALIHGDSVIALAGEEGLDVDTQKKITALLDRMGMIFWTEEEKMNAFTALAGSGPAFIMAIVESLVDGGILLGFSAQNAKSVVLQMVRGAVSLLEHYEGHPGEIRWRISSPKGTTIAGMQAFEEEGIRSAMIRILLAAYEKSKDMR